MLALADYGVSCYPSQAKLAAKCGMSVRAVQTALGALRAAGIVTTESKGKALRYRLELRRICGSCYAESACEIRSICVGDTQNLRRDPNPLLNPLPNPAPADAGGAVGSAWDGIDPDDARRIRRWVPTGADDLMAAQRRVTLRKLAELGIRVSDHARWWRHLGNRWAETGTPPYDAIAAELDGIGTEVRDRVAVLAFRLKLGRVAA